MPDVVGIDESCTGTTRETAATIAAFERPAGGAPLMPGIAFLGRRSRGNVILLIEVFVHDRLQGLFHQRALLRCQTAT